jgi:GrpB-like predicted nucleotidyltransferase (UPF0157 family)
MKKTLQQRIDEAVREEIEIVPYNPAWLSIFEKEKKLLIKKLPGNIIRRIEHFGSTAIPCMAAKPIIDILIEVTSLEETKKRIVPVLKKEGYDYFWRPINNDNNSLHYAWFIKRDSTGKRTHHIHMVEKDSELWDRIFFRDYLAEFPEAAKQYEELKIQLAGQYPEDRISYTEGKTKFISDLTGKAKEYYKKNKLKCSLRKKNYD